MNGNDVVLDTSAAILLLNNLALATNFLSPDRRIFLPAVAIGELLYGAMNSARRAINLPKFESFIDHCEIIPMTRATASIYAEARLSLKRQGLPIPEPDIWIAAAAIERSLPLATTDVHFTRVKGLKLAPFPAAGQQT